MKITEVIVNYGVTRNMGNYESLRLDYSLKVELGPGENSYKTLTDMRHSLRTDVIEAIKEEMSFADQAPKRRG